MTFNQGPAVGSGSNAIAALEQRRSLAAGFRYDIEMERHAAAVDAGKASPDVRLAGYRAAKAAAIEFGYDVEGNLTTSLEAHYTVEAERGKRHELEQLADGFEPDPEQERILATIARVGQKAWDEAGHHQPDFSLAAYENRRDAAIKLGRFTPDVPRGNTGAA